MSSCGAAPPPPLNYSCFLRFCRESRRSPASRGIYNSLIYRPACSPRTLHIHSLSCFKLLSLCLMNEATDFLGSLYFDMRSFCHLCWFLQKHILEHLLCIKPMTGSPRGQRWTHHSSGSFREFAFRWWEGGKKP